MQDILEAYIEDALTGSARMRGSPKRLPVYKHFNLRQALDRLNIFLFSERTVEFDDGSLGWSQARQRNIAVRARCDDPVHVAFHELAHVLLPNQRGRTSARTKAREEVEAELTAFLVKRCLGSKIYLSYSRSYIRNHMERARPLRPRIELVKKVALEIFEAGRTERRVSPGTIGIGIATARRDYNAAERSANFFWKKREDAPDDRLPMPNGFRDPLSEAYIEACVDCGDDDARYIKECQDELCKRCMRARLAWERDHGLIRKSEYGNLVRELSARFG
jgi:hypothetical protein